MHSGEKHEIESNFHRRNSVLLKTVTTLKCLWVLSTPSVFIKVE